MAATIRNEILHEMNSRIGGESMKMNVIVKVIAAVAIVSLAASCVSFEEQTNSRDDEMTAFGEVYLNGELGIEDLEQVGVVEATRTVTYNLSANGDFTVEMGDYTFTYTAASNESSETGTRVVGNLNFTEAPVAEAGGLAAGAGGFIEGLNPFASGESGAPGEEDNSEGPAERGPRGIALDAVNYDLLQAAAEAGGMALLLPEYSWEREETVTGTDMNFPFMAPSRTISTRQVVYTVTARATAVSF